VPTGTASRPSLPPVRASGYRLESPEERRRRAAAERAAERRAEEEEAAPEEAARRAAGRTVAALGKASRVEAARAEKARGRADWVEAAGAKRAGREPSARRETTTARFQANTGTAAEERTARWEEVNEVNEVNEVKEAAAEQSHNREPLVGPRRRRPELGPMLRMLYVCV